MTEKRFGYGADVNWQGDIIIDYETEKSYRFYEVGDLLNDLAEENTRLKDTNQELYDKLQVTMSEKSLRGGEIAILERENKELQKRNDRQAERLNELYNLIEQKDWKALTDIINDFKKAEERLQSEWQAYSGVSFVWTKIEEFFEK